MLVMTSDAAFSHGLVFEDKRARMLQVALRALLIPASHRETGRRFEDFHPVRVMTIDAIHLPFNDRVVMGEPELSLLVDMTIQTGLRITPWIVNFTPDLPATGDMRAARSMARLTASRPRHLQIGFVEATMWTVGKLAFNLLVAGRAFRVANKFGADDGLGRFNRRPLLDRARGPKQARAQCQKWRSASSANFKNLSPHVVQIGGIRPGFPFSANTFVFAAY